MSRSRTRSIVGTWYDPVSEKKPVIKQKTIVENDEKRIDPYARSYMMIRAPLSLGVFVGFYLLLCWAGISEFYAALIGFFVVTWSMLENDAKHFGNRFTVTRHEGIKLDTPTKITDASGRRLTVGDVLPRDFKP